MDLNKFSELDREELIAFIREGFESGKSATFKFFRTKLARVCKGNTLFDDEQINYVAGILTRFSTLGIQGTGWLPMPKLIYLAETADILEKKRLGVSAKVFESAAGQFLFISSFDEKSVGKFLSSQLITKLGSYLFLKGSPGPRSELLLKINFRQF